MEDQQIGWIAAIIVGGTGCGFVERPKRSSRCCLDPTAGGARALVALLDNSRNDISRTDFLAVG